ncbi:MAG TPA: hypothetical protein VKN36_10095 [Eudoraea sp.]|nr:hypothetical protein [Eudoraea sp.]
MLEGIKEEVQDNFDDKNIIYFDKSTGDIDVSDYVEMNIIEKLNEETMVVT